jgi:Mn2+/Fe2+ NRAMP family transporter
VIVAVLGTTISPFLFFWQAAQEVEEERSLGRNLAHRRGATRVELQACRSDEVTGMGDATNSRSLAFVGRLTLAVMVAAALGLVVAS